MIGIRGKLRTRDWWGSKIPPLLAVAYAAILVGDVAWNLALPALLRLMLAIVGVAGFGYVLNDVFDIDEDRRRGKANAMASFSRWQQGLLLLFLASLSLIPLLGGPFSGVSRFLIAINLALPMLYSIPPIRLKERGALGLLADAMGVHAVPTLLAVISIVRLGERPGGWTRTGFILAAGLWALVAGLRGIIVHQVVDRESDLAAGVKTFAGGIDPRTAGVLVFRVSFPAELLALSVLLLFVLPVAPILFGVIPVYALFELLKVLDDWKLPPLDPHQPGGKPYIPLEHNDLYEIWLPVSLGIQLAVSELRFMILPVLHLFVFWPNVRRRLEDLATLMPAIRWLATGQGRAPLCIAPYSGADMSAGECTGLEARKPMPVFVGVTRWCSNGVNLFAAQLVHGLRRDGLDAFILLAHNGADDPARFQRPADVPFVELTVSSRSRWNSEPVAMIRFLEQQAPCIYIPSGDLRYSSVIPLLSDQVGIVKVAHYNADHVGDECEKIVAMAERVGNSAFNRIGSPLHRMAALLHLSRTH